MDTQTASHMQIARIVIFSAIVPLALLVAPVLTTQLMEQYHLNAGDVGTYFLFELGGISLASLPALWWQKRWQARHVATFAAVAFIAGNVASVLAPSFAILCAIRLATALAGGSLMVLCLNAAAAHRNSERVFGLWVTGQLVLGAIGLWLLPRLFGDMGVAPFYALSAGLMLLALPLAFGFATPPSADRYVRDAPVARSLVIALAIGSVILFYLAIGGSWAFFTLIGTEYGVPKLQAADVVAAASLMGIVGAFAASIAAGRVRGIWLLSMGFGALALSVALLLVGGKAQFAMAAYLFKFSWTFTLPAVLATIGRSDPGGTIMSWTNLVIGSSSAIGPIIAGGIVDHLGSQSMLLFALILIGGSASAILILARNLTRGSAVPA